MGRGYTEAREDGVGYALKEDRPRRELYVDVSGVHAEGRYS